MLPIISEKSKNNMTSDVSLEELSEELETNQTMSSSELNPELIEGLKELLQASKHDQNQQNVNQGMPTSPWMNMWNPYQWNPSPTQQQFQQSQQQVLQTPTNASQFVQPTPVPKFSKTMSMEAWKRKLNVWSSNHGYINESLKLNMILDSLKENSDRKELNNWIVYNIEEDVNFDLTASDAIDQFLQKFQKKFEISDWKKCSIIWREVLDFKAHEGEETREYLDRFNEMEVKMKNVGTCIPDVYMAIHLLERSNIPDITKQNILSKVDMDDKNKVLEQVKTTFDNLVNNLENESTKINYWSTNKKDQRAQSTSEDYRPRWRERTEDRRSRSFNFQRRERSRSNTRQRSRSRGYDQGYRRPREVFTCVKFNLDQLDIRNNKDTNNVFLSKTENKCVIDSGCPKTVAGKLWVNLYKQSLMNMEEFKDFHFKEYEENENFKFGPSQVYTSTKAIVIPMKIGNKIFNITVSQVNANIPLLFGRDYMKKWKCDLSFNNNTLKVDNEIEVKLEINDKGHFTMDMIDAETEVIKIVNETFFLEGNHRQKYENINKIHKITAHKRDKIVSLLKDHKNYNNETEEIISEVINNCQTCKRFKKSKDSPNVSESKENVKDAKKCPKGNKVHFCQQDESHSETTKETREKEIQMDENGVKVLYYTQNNMQILESEQRINEVLVTEIPKKYHNAPEVIEAKESEITNFNRFEAYEEVDDIGQTRITSRWVVTEKEAHDGMKKRIKARLVVRGFQEEEDPRSDSPTLAKESLKTMMAIAANEKFTTKCMDITNAYLQGKEITRDVFVEPPSDYKKEGKIWKLKKTVYGTYDGSRNFYLSVDETLRKLGCKKVTGEEALYTFHDENGKLAGMVGIHVDDFNAAGNEYFHEKITDELQKIYVFGKIEEKEFRFTGVDIKECEDGIEVNQAKFCESLKEIEISDKRNTERELTTEEYKKFRGAIGKLNWLQESTRPDLSFDNLNMSMKNKNATVGDVNKMNKIIRKAKEGAEDSKLKFQRIDDFKNLKIYGFADASYKTQDNKVRSVEGRILFLTNGKKASPIMWKSKKIARVCDSTKTAETLAMDKVTDDAIYMARMIQEIYTGKNSTTDQLPVTLFTDSKPLFESIYSTKQIDRKSIRHVVHIMKDAISRGEVEKYIWVDTKNMLADVLTKESADSQALKRVFENGDIDIQIRKEEAGEDCQSLSFRSSHNDLYKPCNNNHMHSFQ